MSQIFKAVGGLSGKGLSGTLNLPGDKSISHRALMLACLAEGESEITGLANGADVAHTLKAVQALGARIEAGGTSESLSAPLSIIGMRQLKRAKKPINVGNSGTGIRLLAGLCAGQNFTTCLYGDSSISRRTMVRIINPLKKMNARIHAKNGYAPLLIVPAELKGIDYELPVASAQVKSAILLAGLFARGVTRVIEKIPSRVHTEEMLEDFGAEIKCSKNSEGNREIEIHQGQLSARNIQIPGDPSAAAFWAVAATIIPESSVKLNNVYLGTARNGWLDVLKRMGADIEIAEKEAEEGHTDNKWARTYAFSEMSDQVHESHAGNKWAQAGQTAERQNNAHTIHIKSAELHATDIAAEEIPGLIDEIPILCIAAAHARGITRFLETGELRHKESNRILALEQAFNALSGNLKVQEDALEIKGTGGFNTRGEITIDSYGDHRIAMAFAIAALAGNKNAAPEISIKKFNNAVATSYPDFLRDLRALQS